MRRLRFLQYDVFTREPFGGNQLAVFLDGDSLSDEKMQTIAREMNNSETTFIQSPSDPKALCRVRIFTPATELPFAGHPVIGTTFALANAGLIRADESPVTLQCGIGLLPVEVLYEDGRVSFVWMHQPVPHFEPWQGDADRLASALGLSPDDFDDTLPIERAIVGVNHVLVPIRSLGAIGRARPESDLLEALNLPGEHPGCFLFTLDVTETADIHGRMFAPAMGIGEDPATGSAAGPLGVYLLRHKRLSPDETGQTRARLEQGIEMGRPSVLDIAITSSAERAESAERADHAATIEDVRVGGASVLMIEGELLLP
jgi:trans-2,3-dihydro-3-hydroxyanthranilate isomerase